ncbi:MAG: helix-hairpin-helix domain-containing protein, partial [Gammaproteobacteria bacterium]|nr:helix-hairpin-helix domain-containing protein [Gammaproteobacteria bacterium]
QQRREDRELAEFAAKLKERRPSHRSPDVTPLDLNRATRAQLESIKGIGPTLAERIIAARPYSSTDALLKVRGIGPATLRKIQPYVTVAK